MESIHNILFYDCVHVIDIKRTKIWNKKYINHFIAQNVIRFLWLFMTYFVYTFLINWFAHKTSIEYDEHKKRKKKTKKWKSNEKEEVDWSEILYRTNRNTQTM